MKTVLTLFLITLYSSAALATFELEDPQAELEAWQEAIYSENSDGSRQAETHLMICQLGGEQEYCECRNKKTDEKLDISFEACRAIVEKEKE